ncbi:MAG: methyltransferase domain-containing protein [Xanthomonadales bacterium]|nr:methyltransferase domain-containing protein [Xanthomonadales bacterium]
MPAHPRKTVLNVGGNDRSIALPRQYDDYDQVWLDIDPAVQPDILCDARTLEDLEANSFDAVYCSHNLEHYYRHEVPSVLAGFRHVLRSSGFAQLRVPDIPAVMRAMIDGGLDLEDELYRSPAGPISTLDVLYGYGVEIETSGNDFFAHKTGFSARTLYQALLSAGFKRIYCTLGNLEINAVAFMSDPDPDQRRRFNIKESP